LIVFEFLSSSLKFVGIAGVAVDYGLGWW